MRCVVLRCVILLTPSQTSFRASLTVTIVSTSYFSSSKTVPNTPCLYNLYRMYTSTNMDSWIDLCITAFPNLASPGYPKNDIYCSNCPVGPFLDFTHLVRSDVPLQLMRRILPIPCAVFFSDNAVPPAEIRHQLV